MTPIERKEYNKRWREQNKERVKELHQSWYQKNKDKVGYKDHNYISGIKKRYGITIEEVTQLLNKQSNKCAICGNVFVNRKRTHIDHCHNTGKIRGMLCEGCNIGLGGFKDNIVLLHKAIGYLSVSNEIKDVLIK